MVKASAYNARDLGSIPGLGRSAGEGIYSLEEKTDLKHDCIAAKKSVPRGVLQAQRGHVTTGDLKLKNGLGRLLRCSDFEKRLRK